MGLYVSSLNSGSNGNCYYVGNSADAVLIDAGISSRETEKRMKRIGLSVRKVKAIFVTHEHSDHIRGVRSLSKRYDIPVYITPGTLAGSGLKIRKELVLSFQPYVPVTVGSLQVTAFPKFHDAIDPHSFIVTDHRVRVGVFTDIGRPCSHVIRHFKQCHAAFLEANYDEDMLEKGSYPLYLKDRIRNGHGHLSNMQAAELFAMYRPSFMSHLFLSHLSRNNNEPSIVEALFRGIAASTEIIVASRYRETGVYEIRPGRVKGRVSHEIQLSFWD